MDARPQSYNCDPASHSSSHPSSIPAAGQYTSCEPAQLRVAFGAHSYSAFDKAKQKPVWSSRPEACFDQSLPFFSFKLAPHCRGIWASGTADLQSLELGDLDSNHHCCSTAPEPPRL